MGRKPTAAERKWALFNRYKRVYQNYYGKDRRPPFFLKSWSYRKCEEAYETLKQTIHQDKTQRRYLARIAGLPLTPDVQNEYLAQSSLRRFFTDAQIVHFPYEAVENPHFRSARPMKLYTLYDVMQVARRKQFTPRIKPIDWDNIDRNKEKLQKLEAYFVQYLEHHASDRGA